MEAKKITWDDLQNNPDKLLTTDQVKQILDVSDPTLFRWRKIKLIPYYLIGGIYRYKAEDIWNFINSSKETNRKP